MPFRDNATGTPADGVPAGSRVPAGAWALATLALGLALTVWLAQVERRRSEGEARRVFVQEHLIARYGIAPQRLVFEITETVAIRNYIASGAPIARLRELGCRVALDDFGAGMSSFGYLKNLALDMVKIDGSFVQHLAHDPMSQSIVKAVTEIGHQQGLAVVAEWVATQEMIELLASMGVDYAQGFALHRPERAVFQR